MHDNVLVLPENGPDFLRAVKLASLYADRVHVYCPTNEEYLNSLGKMAKQIHPSPDAILRVLNEAATRDPSIAADMNESPTFKQDLAEGVAGLVDGLPLTTYLRTCVANRSDLEVLRQEGVVVSIVDNAYPNLPKGNDPWPAFMVALQAYAEGANKSQLHKLRAKAPFLRDFTSRGHSASAFFDSILAFVAFAAPHSKEYAAVLRKLKNEGLRRSIAGGVFFLTSSFYASENQCVGVTWDGKTQDCFEKFCDVLYAGQKDNNPYILRRERIRARIGRQVLEDQVPDVSRLPIEAILEVRRKRQGELKYFRDSLSKLASEIDPELRGAELTAAVDAVIQTEIKPALNDLNASLANLETGRTHRLWNPESDVVRFAISSMIGVPVGMPLQIGAMGVFASKLVDYTFGHKNAKAQTLRSSPWSILFHLNKKRR